MKHLLVDNRETPLGRKFKHHGRSFCGPRHGHWNAWCPSGVDIDPTAAETDDTKKDEQKQQERKPDECPFKANVDQAKKAAEMFQNTAPDFLMHLGNTIGTILSQFGKPY